MDALFEARGHCKHCNKTSTKQELLLNGGLCWRCRGELNTLEKVREKVM